MECQKVHPILAVCIGIAALASAICCCPGAAPEGPPTSVVCDAGLDARHDAPAPPSAADASPDAKDASAPTCPPPKVSACACVPKPAPTPGCGQDCDCGTGQVCLEGVCKFKCETDLYCRQIDARIGYCAKDNVCRSAP